MRKKQNLEVGWCGKHEGMHERRAECVEYRFQTELIACDAHGNKPHLRNADCINTRNADPFYGF